eukprot:6649993-Pyramimonas_sp.AAC.2
MSAFCDYRYIVIQTLGATGQSAARLARCQRDLNRSLHGAVTIATRSSCSSCMCANMVFKFAGLAANLPEEWALILCPPETAPKGSAMDPPTPVSRHLGCERRLSERWIDWRGEDPTAVGPLPPKAKKTKGAAAASASFCDLSPVKAAGMTLVYTDRPYPVPGGQSARV